MRNSFSEEIIVGSGPDAVTTILVHQISDQGNSNLSDNSIFYRARVERTGHSLRIYKDTELGAWITKLVEEKASWYEVEELLLSEILRRMKPVDLVDLLTWVRKEGFEEGKRSKVVEIRKALELPLY